MRELVKMFDYTRMIVLLSLTAGLYTSLLILFKAFVIIPGYTEIRPGSVIPVVCSLFFGPAAAWGAAFGNLIGDFFGMLGVSSIFGMAGNFLYGYIPYRIWLQGKDQSLNLRSGRNLVRYFIAAITASMACVISIAWGLDLLGMVPFVVFSNIALINNLLATLILGPILILLLTPRVQAWGLLYRRIMKDSVKPSPRLLHYLGFALIWGGGLTAIITANLHAFIGPTMIDHPIALHIAGQAISIHLGITPGTLLMIVGCLLI